MSSSTSNSLRLLCSGPAALRLTDRDHSPGNLDDRGDRSATAGIKCLPPWALQALGHALTPHAFTVTFDVRHDDAACEVVESTASRFGSERNTQPSRGIPLCARYSSRGTRTWQINGMGATDSFVLGVSTSPRQSRSWNGSLGNVRVGCMGATEPYSWICKRFQTSKLAVDSTVFGTRGGGGSNVQILSPRPLLFRAVNEFAIRSVRDDL